LWRGVQGSSSERELSGVVDHDRVRSAARPQWRSGDGRLEGTLRGRQACQQLRLAVAEPLGSSPICGVARIRGNDAVMAAVRTLRWR
jgi:hypothetical protein